MISIPNTSSEKNVDNLIKAANIVFFNNDVFASDELALEEEKKVTEFIL